jgi:hypothetical protein
MKILILFFQALLFCSCVFASDGNIQDTKIYSFKKVRVSFEGPLDLRCFESAYGDLKVFLQFYPMKRPAHMLSDTLYRVKITIRRTEVVSLDHRKNKYLKSDLYKNSSLEERESWFWGFEIHEAFSCRDDGQYLYCRKDVILEHGEMLTAEAEILDSKWQNITEKENAEKDIRMILNTIKTME